MIELIEVGDGTVLEVTITPDAPGYRRRDICIKQISGPALTDEEWQEQAHEMVRKLIDNGNTVHSVEVGWIDA